MRRSGEPWFSWPPFPVKRYPPPVIGTRVFVENLERLKLDPVGILSIHTMNPDRMVTVQDIRSSLGL